MAKEIERIKQLIKKFQEDPNKWIDSREKWRDLKELSSLVNKEYKSSSEKKKDSDNSFTTRLEDAFIKDLDYVYRMHCYRHLSIKLKEESILEVGYTYSRKPGYWVPGKEAFRVKLRDFDTGWILESMGYGRILQKAYSKIINEPENN